MVLAACMAGWILLCLVFDLFIFLALYPLIMVRWLLSLILDSVAYWLIQVLLSLDNLFYCYLRLLVIV